MSRWGEGRPPHKPTQKDAGIVRALVLSGHSQEQIAKICRIGVKTLVKHYRDILDNEKPKALATVAANLFRQATKDDFRSVGAAAFIMKTQAGWKEKSEVAVTGPDGGPIQTRDLSGLTDDDLDAVERIVRKVADAGGNPGRED